MTDSINDQLYLPIYDTIPDNWNEARYSIVERFTNHAESINSKSIGWYYDVETDTGKKFIPVTNESTSEQYRTIFRKVVDCGALPDTTTTNTEHGITVDDNFCLIQLYGSATKPTSAYAALPIPYASATSTDVIEINMDATYINITTSKDYTSYTKCFVVVEYIQEV